VDQKKSLDHFTSIKAFVAKTVANEAPIIPVSAQRRLNIDAVCQFLATLPVPIRDLTSPPLMTVVRSFEVNKAGQDDIDKLFGGVAGGSLIRGVLRVGQLIEVRPGVVFSAQGVTKCRPVRATVTSISSEQNKLEFAVPGGLIGVGTTLDPSLTKRDALVGHVIGIPDHMPPVYQTLVISYAIIKRAVGIEEDTPSTSNKSEVTQTTTNNAANNNDKKKNDNNNKNEKIRGNKLQTSNKTKNENDNKSKNKNETIDVKNFQAGEQLKVNVGSCSTLASVERVCKDIAKLRLQLPCCAEIKQKISLSRRINEQWRLVGFGIIRDGSIAMELEHS